jgi:hypothetical protein
MSFISALLVGGFAGDSLGVLWDSGFGPGRFASVNAVALPLSQWSLLPVVDAIAMGLAAALLVWLVSTFAAVFLMRRATSSKVPA